MIHKNAYEFFLEDNTGLLHPFSEADTWKYIFELHSPKIISILHKMIIKSRGGK